MVATVALIAALIALTAYHQLSVAPLASAASNAIWLTLQILPLILVLPGLVRLGTRSYFFAIIAAMLYFVHGVLLAVEPRLELLGLIETGLSVLLIATASFAVRALRHAEAARSFSE